MKQIFTFLMALSCAFLVPEKILAQSLCSVPLTVNFNDTTVKAASFTGDLAYAYDVTNNGTNSTVNGYLQATNVSATPSSEWYHVYTPLLQPLAITNSLNYGFTLGGSEKVDHITVYIEFYNALGQVQTEQVFNMDINSAVYTSNGVSGTYTFCQTGIPFPSGYVLGTPYRLKIALHVPAPNGNNTNTTLTFDDFRSPDIATLIILPVHFSSLSVQRIPAGAQLTWKVEAEENVSVYEVQWSTDGRNFSKLNTVEATGLSSYAALDNRAAVGPVFYRIKSVDIDGRFLYSTVVVLAGDKSSVQMKAFMSNGNTLTVQHDAAEAGSRVMVCSLDGRVVKSRVATVGSQQSTVDLSAAQRGLYIVRFDNGAVGTQSIKFIKQ